MSKVRYPKGEAPRNTRQHEQDDHIVDSSRGERGNKQSVADKRQDIGQEHHDAIEALLLGIVGGE